MVIQRSTTRPVPAALWSLVLRQVAFPEQLSCRELQAMQLALYAVGVDAIPLDDRRAAWAAAVAVGVPVVGGRTELPEELSGLRMQALDHLLVSESVEEHEAFPLDGGCGIAVALLHLPDERRSLRAPFLQQGRLG